MAWKLNDLTLQTGSVVPVARDGARSLGLVILCTPAELAQIQGMCENRGKVERVSLAGGRETVIDTTGTANTILLTSGAPTHVQSGWYAVDDYDSDWSKGPTKAVVRLELTLLVGAKAATGACDAATEYVTNDFTAYADAKTQVALPVYAAAPRKPDGTAPTLRFMPVGVNLLTDGTAAWISNSGAVIAADGAVKKVTASSVKVTRGASGYAAYQDVVVDAGVVYQLAGWLLNDGGAAAAELNLWWLDSTDTMIGGINYAAASHASATRWGYYGSGVFQAPVGTVKARVWIGTNGAGYVHADAVTLRACLAIAESPYVEPAAQGKVAGGSIEYDALPASTHGFLGDVRVYDLGTQTNYTLAESSYTRVRGRRHAFAGLPMLDNGLVRVVPSTGSGTYVYEGRVVVYVNGAWVDAGGFGMHMSGLGGTRINGSVEISHTLVRVTPAEVVMRVSKRWKESTYDKTHTYLLRLKRGMPYVSIEYDHADWSNIQLAQSMAYHWTDTLSTFIAANNPGGIAAPNNYGLGYTNNAAFLALVASPMGANTYYNGRGRSTKNFKVVHIGALPFPHAVGYHQESNVDTTLNGAAAVADGSTLNGFAVRLDASGDNVARDYTAGYELPRGEYVFAPILKDSNQVASDVVLEVENVTKGTALVSSAKTATSAYAVYGALFSLAAADDGDTIRVKVRKASASVNNVDVDYWHIVPKARVSASPSWLWFPQELAHSTLMQTTSREAVRSA